MDEFEIEFNAMQEEKGLIDPVAVNQSEKDEFQLEFEQIKSSILKKDINEGKQISYNDMSWGNVVLEGISNLGPSYMNYFENFADMLAHPFLAAKSIKRLTTGIAKLGTLHVMYGMNLENIPFDLTEEQDQDVMMAMNFEKEMFARYGTEQGFKKSLAEDPFGVLADVASVLVPIAKVTKATGLNKAGNAMAKYTQLLEPVKLTTATVRGISHGIMNMPIVKKMPSSLMSRSLKLSDKIPIDRIKNLVKIALDNKTNVVFKNVENLQEQIGELERIKDKLIDNLTFEKTHVPVMPFDQSFKGLSELEVKLLKVSGQKVTKRNTSCKNNFVKK
jgi:hypothetical protein